MGFKSFITERTRRFHPGCDRSSAAVAQPRRSHKPRATPGDLLTPILQCRTTRSALGQLSMNFVIAAACSRANRMSVGSPISVMSLNESLRMAAKPGEMRAGSASGSEIEMQTSRPRGSYASASSRESTTRSGARLGSTLSRDSAPRFPRPASRFPLTATSIWAAARRQSTASHQQSAQRDRKRDRRRRESFADMSDRCHAGSSK